MSHINKYLDIDEVDIRPDFCGIRPKLQSKEESFMDFYIHNEFVWTTNGKVITLTDIRTEQEWDIPLERAMGNSHIYSLSCDDEWVWFLTNNGVIFYNWTTYNNAQN